MLVLSFDVGTRNMAVCGMLLCESSWPIVLWEVVDLGHAKSGIPEAVEWLRTLPMADVVLIESQRGARMKMLQYAIATYFHVRSSDAGKACVVEFVPPKRKMLEQCGKLKTYRQRKKFSVERTAEIIAPDGMEWFKGHKKKDDLADSFLQCWAHLRFKQFAAKPVVVLPQCDEFGRWLFAYTLLVSIFYGNGNVAPRVLFHIDACFDNSVPLRPEGQPQGGPLHKGGVRRGRRAGKTGACADEEGEEGTAGPGAPTSCAVAVADAGPGEPPARRAPRSKGALHVR
jgi:hypothetical protein